MTWFRLHLMAFVHTLRVRRELDRKNSLMPVFIYKKRARPMSQHVVNTALLASRRAVVRFCPLNSCLTRSVVLYRLLASYEGVAIHYGFRRRDGALEGHAWVTVDGIAVGEPDGARDGYIEMAVPPSTAAFG